MPMAVDRSKRYDNPVHADKQGGGKKNPSLEQQGNAETKAAATAGDPPSPENEKGAIHRPDAGPDPGRGPAFGEVAERHKREIADMNKRHETEVNETMARHGKERVDTAKRHAKEVEDHWASQEHHPDDGGSPGTAESGTGPKLGKTESESTTGEAMKKDSASPKLGKTEDKGKGGTEP